MQFSPKNWSIRTKLAFLALFTAALALAVAFFGITISTRSQFTSSMRLELQSLAEIVVQVAEPAVVFKDQESAQRLLSALRTKENIIAATIADSDGTILASYKRRGPTADTASPNFTLSGTKCESTLCYTTLPILNDGGTPGFVHIVSDLSELNAQLKENARVMVITLLFSLIVALTVAYLLQRIISGPLVNLATLVAKVSSNNDYSLRADEDYHGSTKNEIGTLVRGLNYMLNQIERQDIELRRARDEAQLANEAKSAFVANTSHEIRTPINNIIGFTEMLAESISSPSDARFIALIKSSAESLLGVINDILDISKMEAGHLELDPVPRNIEHHVSHTLAPLAEQAKNKGLKFTLNIDQKIPETIYIDAVRFGQVLINLVNNAIKFTPCPGSILVSITAITIQEHFVDLEVAVQDSGLGIPLEAQAKIFEPFKQVDASTTRKFGGTGLGLAICHHIVSKMGGQIRVESKVGNGSCFSFILRLATTEEPIEIRNTTVLPDITKSDSFEWFKVLVVEDNPLSREIAVHRLRKAGLNVAIAESGPEAIKLSADCNFNLILMDCQMPDMDGFEATAGVRKLDADLGRHTPIVAFTAHAIEGYRDICLNAGMDDYITKPITEADLIRFVRRFAQHVDSGHVKSL
jgi:signal transduction histidine kinase/ActR/RegA family two-component response regulator